MVRPSVSHFSSTALHLVADDYFLFNPDLYEDKHKQQHSNFLMTPYKYYANFVDLPSTDLFANSYIAGVTFFSGCPFAKSLNRNFHYVQIAVGTEGQNYILVE